MKEYDRFMLFSVSEFYPVGGLGDCVFSASRKRDCKIVLSDYYGRSWYIFDRVKGIVVEESED